DDVFDVFPAEEGAEVLGVLNGNGPDENGAAGFVKVFDFVEIPTNKPLVRTEHNDVIYRTPEEKWDASVNEIKDLHESGRPVLVGTISIQNSEHLSTLLRRKNIKHVVLNAKYHESEAKIISQAGRVGAVTLATNMAGRGVDILLGGNPEMMGRESIQKQGKNPDEVDPEVLQASIEDAIKTTEEEKKKVLEMGGLHILGTERHEARRIDNQLRGRAGRQGDPGSSRFYLSLGDDLMRIFGSERLSGLMARIGMQEGVPIEHGMVSKAIERAQKQVEGQNFSIRKHLLEYDDVMNKQRSSIYSMRRNILKGENKKEYIHELIESLTEWMMESHTGLETPPEDWDFEGFRNAIGNQFGLDINELEINRDEITYDELRERVISRLKDMSEEKERLIGTEQMREFERIILLQIIDTQWKDHLLGMDYLKEGIGLRGYGQRDPLIEYKKESYSMYQDMMDRIEEDTVKYLFLLKPVVEEDLPDRREQPVYYQRAQGGPQAQPRGAQQARSMIPKKRKKKKKK
ncbi:MAG: preprotein translocase subunit SecA, partial [Acidobacteria bacterium]|nr:preprotein translocase subunit SecA [Acidobacteriota bacterium]